MFCPVQKAMDLLSLRLLFILMASSFGLARLLRGSGSQYFNSSVATFKEMAVLLLTQDRATSIPKLLPHGYPCSWSTFSIILVKAKGVEATDANSCCVASCQESPENRLLVASFFWSFCAFEDNYKATWPWSLRTALQVKPVVELFPMGAGITVPQYRWFFSFCIINIHTASRLTPPSPALPQHGPT